MRDAVDAHHEHAEVDQRGVLQKVERRVREHHLLDDVLQPFSMSSSPAAFGGFDDGGRIVRLSRFDM